MANYITVDGGTTNTRLYLVRDGSIACAKRLSVGARNGDAALKSAIKQALAELLCENGLEEKDVAAMIASGMITSEYGICNLPHITAPAGVKELHNAIFETVIEDISEIPFVFIRGVKKECTYFDEADVMRGEETELIGMYKANTDSCLYVLPGSHSKHVSVDNRGRIVDFRTMMTGELFAAVIQHTILKDTTTLACNEIQKTELLKGFYYTQKRGINESLFKTRILKTMFNGTPQQCYSFLLGCVLYNEVESILQANEKIIVLGGQKQFRTALALLLDEISDKKIITLSDSEVESSTSLGAIQIFEF